VCFLSFTSTSTLKHVMTDFSTTAPGADSVMLRIEAHEGRSLQPYSLVENEPEVLLAPNALCEVSLAVGADDVKALASFPGCEQLPARTAMVVLKQRPTPIPVVTQPIVWCTVMSANDALALTITQKRAVRVRSDENGTLAALIAVGDVVRHLHLDAHCDAVLAQYVRNYSALISLRLASALQLLSPSPMRLKKKRRRRCIRNRPSRPRSPLHRTSRSPARRPFL
jgi:hypothetical protein